MKKFSLIFTLLFVSCSINNAYSASVFTARSSDLENSLTIGDKHVYNGFGCSGKNISPQISWSDVPKETKSFAVTVYDPDAPTGSGWWHYVALNIPATYNNLPQDFAARNSFKTTDDVLQVRNDFGLYRFGGPCPPKGDKAHRYVFTVYALKVEKLEVSEFSTAAFAGFMINQNVIAKAQFVASYGR